MLLNISIILIIISILLIIISVYCIKNTHKINKEIDATNKLKQQQYEDLENNISLKQREVENIKNILYNIDKEKNDKEYYYAQQIKSLDNSINDKQKQLDNIQNNVTKSLETKKAILQSAFENYCEVLIKSYDAKEAEYNASIELLKESYSDLQMKMIKEAEQEKERISNELLEEQKILDKVRETRNAAIQAQLREQEIKDKLSFYCLTIKKSELDDIKVLERVKEQLHAPRILSMLVWQTYFQKPMTTLCNNVIGLGIKSGIYKITNQKTNICYIGQATDLATRWKQHAKCGLGIDTPQGNKLYKAMQEDGLWNFSFEVLEECPPALLNEKEKYYIELYQSKEFGYNSVAGNSK